jgi:DNA-directed RNA polymerase I subunit RPA2
VVFKKNLNYKTHKIVFFQFLKSFGAPHTDSFNYFLREGLADCVKNIPKLAFLIKDGSRIAVWIEDCKIVSPTVPLSFIHAKDKNVYPTECRQTGQTYKGQCTVTVGWSKDGVRQPSLEKDMGGVPIMLQSSACNLSKMSPAELVDHGEKENEWGGYFIVKGHEKLIRMLMLSRKNYPIGLRRSTWKDRGIGFSDLGLLIRCVKLDNTSTVSVC